MTAPTQRPAAPTQAMPIQLCSPCESDNDCGNHRHLECGNQGTCVCESFWEDKNGNPLDGCEMLNLDVTINHGQCPKTPVATTSTMVITSTTPQVEESTLVMENPEKIDVIPTACPSSWKNGKPEAVMSKQQDGLLSTTGLCEVKFLQVCTTDKFARKLGPFCQKTNIARVRQIDWNYRY